MADTLLINSVDKTSLLQRPSTVIEFDSVNRSLAYFSLITTASALGSTDGLIVGQDVKIKDGTTVLFGGVIKKLRIYRLEPEIGNTKTIRVDVTCNDYNDIPSRRVTSSYFTDTDAGTIVEAMIDDVMGLTGYDDGIGTGTVSTGATINTYSVNAKTVKDVLDDMAEASGFKWYIDKVKDLYFIQDDTVTVASHDLVETTPTFTDFNILDVEISNVNYVNKQWVLGSLDDTGAQVNVSAEDATEISARATAEGGSGVYGGIINATESQDATEAEDIADNGLKVYGKMPYIVTFTSYTNDWVAGTKLKCNLPTVGIASDTYFLIENVTMIDMGTCFMSEVSATRRNSSDFSTQRTETYVDYFDKLLKGNKVIVDGGSGSGTGTGVKLFSQDAEPTGASEKDVWVDTNDYSNSDIQILSASTSPIDLDDGYIVFVSGSSVTLTLDSIANYFAGTDTTDVSPNAGVIIEFVNTDASSSVTIARGSTDTIEGSTSYTLAASGSVKLYAQNTLTDWKVR